MPGPRLHLIRYHGLMAPNAKLRARVVPRGPPAQGHAASEVEARAECEEVEPMRTRPQRMGWARLSKRVFDARQRAALDGDGIAPAKSAYARDGGMRTNLAYGFVSGRPQRG